MRALARCCLAASKGRKSEDASLKMILIKEKGGWHLLMMVADSYY